MTIIATASGPRAIKVTDGQNDWIWHFPLTPDGKDLPSYMQGPELRDFKKFDQLQKAAASLATRLGLIPNPADVRED